MITVTCTAQSNTFVTADYAINFLGLDSSDEANVKVVIEEVLANFESVLGRPLAYQEYSETTPGYGEHNLRLSRYPVSTTSVTVLLSTATVSSTAYAVDSSAGMLFNSTGWKWTAALKGDVVMDKWPASEDGSYVVTYGAGYHLPSTATPGDPSMGAKFPADLRAAGMRTLKLWWTDLFGGSSDFKKFRTDDLEIENYAPPLDALLLGYGDLPVGVERVLDRFKLDWGG